jgi:hypothetical protein
MCAFLQLVVFAGMAAFTNSFDITEGLVPSSSDAQLIKDITFNLTGSTADLVAEETRNNRLPILNDRGISIVMGCSRLLMLAQYIMGKPLWLPHMEHLKPTLIVYYHARLFRRHSIMVHISSTFLSAILYFAAYGALSSVNPSKADFAAKVVLWYLPILIEIVAHFLANRVPGRVSYSVTSVFARSSTLFIVVLGIGELLVFGSALNSWLLTSCLIDRSRQDHQSVPICSWNCWVWSG